MKIFSEIIKRKRFDILTVRGSKIGVMSCFPYVQGRDHRFFIDNFNFFAFSRFHGYAPFLIFANQLATGLNQDEYSLFHSTARLTTI
jgi:hypothetical protein